MLLAVVHVVGHNRRGRHEIQLTAESWKRIDEMMGLKALLTVASDALEIQYRAKSLDIRRNMRSGKREFVIALARKAQTIVESNDCRTVYFITWWQIIQWSYEKRLQLNAHPWQRAAEELGGAFHPSRYRMISDEILPLHAAFCGGLRRIQWTMTSFLRYLDYANDTRLLIHLGQIDLGLEKGTIRARAVTTKPIFSV